MEKGVVIFGTQDCAILADFYLTQVNLNVVAFCVDDEYHVQEKISDKSIIKFSEVDKKFPPKEFDFFAPIYSNELREKTYHKIIEKGYECISYVSPKCTCFGKVGKNCFIMEDNTIQPFVEIGDNVILWSGNHIGHHTKIASNVFVSSHVVISGHCEIIQYCWLGVNSTIKDHIKLAEGTFIGMASCVLKNTRPYMKYFGCPAKEIGTCGKN